MTLHGDRSAGAQESILAFEVAQALFVRASDGFWLSSGELGNCILNRTQP